jgi:hypothetical protein
MHAPSASHPPQPLRVCCTGRESPALASTLCDSPKSTRSLMSEAAAAGSAEVRSALALDTLKSIDAQQAELKAAQAHTGSGCRSSARRQDVMAQKLNELRVRLRLKLYLFC